MNSTFICHITEEEKRTNSQLLESFQSSFSANSNANLIEMFHPKGHFFGKMSRHKACGVFHTIFLVKMLLLTNYG